MMPWGVDHNQANITYQSDGSEVTYDAVRRWSHDYFLVVALGCNVK